MSFNVNELANLLAGELNLYPQDLATVEKAIREAYEAGRAAQIRKDAEIAESYYDWQDPNWEGPASGQIAKEILAQLEGEK